MKIERLETESLERLSNLLERISDEPLALRLRLSVTDELKMRQVAGCAYMLTAVADNDMLVARGLRTMVMHKQGVLISRSAMWRRDSVRTICIDNGWYDAGDNPSYEEMLQFVSEHQPTDDNIYLVAADILEHTVDPDLPVESVMFELANNAVKYSFVVVKKGVNFAGLHPGDLV